VITSLSTFGTDPCDPADPDAVEPDPMRLLRAWLPPNTSDLRPLMQLSTIDADGYPDARSVLLSEVDDGGLYFHTSSHTRKAAQLAALPRACAVLAWPEVGRQLVVQGEVEPVPALSARAAYHARGYYLQLLAWTNSTQMAQRPIAERRARFEEYARAHPEGTLEPPDSWIGFRIIPRRLTFWRGDELGPSNRTEYRRQAPDQPWSITKLDG
jgi:pyridoxamine 5'-phosphate oxidase